MTADLHIHTTASDGRLAPGEIVRQAKLAGLSVIAITDHDTIGGVITAIKAANDRLLVIPGIELNTDMPNHEVHVLGYYIDMQNRELLDELEQLAADRLSRVRKITDNLAKLGYPLDYGRVLDIAGASDAVGRPHIAKALIEKGYFANISDVFDTVLATNGPAYVPHYKLTPIQAIKLIRAANGIAVLAHPGLIGDDGIIHEMISAGIQGLEAYHPKHSGFQTQTYVNLANRYGLIVTGGSDFHGIPGRYPERLGQFIVPAALAEKLRPGQA